MPKHPKISVIIPAYNEAKRLPACLDALAAQTVRPHEVIVVDNDSSDGSAAVAAQYDFVRVVHERQRGRVYARNAGFRRASGDIFARIDADAIVPPDWVAWVSRFYAGGHETVALTGGAHFYNMRPSRLISGTYNWLIFRFNALLTGSPTLWGSSMALPKTLWQQVANNVCLDNTLHEDLDLSFHVRRVGGRIHYDSSSKVRVEMRRIHTENKALWPYLQMWPRTLRRHGYWSWPLCWFVGALLLYLASPLPVLYERLFGGLRRKRTKR